MGGRQLVCAEILLCWVALARLLHFTDQDDCTMQIEERHSAFILARLRADRELAKAALQQSQRLISMKTFGKKIDEYCNSVSKKIKAYCIPKSMHEWFKGCLQREHWRMSILHDQGWKALEIMDPALRSDKEFAMMATRQQPSW